VALALALAMVAMRLHWDRKIAIILSGFTAFYGFFDCFVAILSVLWLFWLFYGYFHPKNP
jgi:hypothetical protein